MSHPILSHHRTLQVYFITWFSMALTHWGIMFLVTDTSIFNAVIDSLVHNGLMMVMGLGIWYPVAYTGAGKTWTTIISHHLFTGLVWVTIWLFGGKIIVGWLMKHDEVFWGSGSTALVIRAVIGGLMFMLFVVVYYLFVFQQNLQERIQNEEKMNSLLRETELNALKAQLNPHFLFNSLNSVSALTISEPDAAREMVNKLSEFLRYSIRKNEHSLLTLRDELRNISRYLEIEKVRFGDKLLYEFHIPAEYEDMTLPAMILQPLYENAIKHGVYESIEPVNIRTFCKTSNGVLEISIINNFDPELKSKKGEGVGLINVSDRLRMVYGRNDLIKIVKENGFYEATVMIPEVTQRS